MTMQDRGFTRNLEVLCETFDSSLQVFLEDIQIYLYGVQKNTNSNSRSSFDDDVKHLLSDKSSKDYGLTKLFCDRSEIENYLRDISKTNVER